MQAQQPNMLSQHQALWEQLRGLIQKNQFPQVSLFIGAPDAFELIQSVVSTLLCDNQTACGVCKSCLWIAQNSHPDLQRITLEHDDKAIKIESIRCLQQSIYQVPTHSVCRIILIHPANKLNHAAANALLKILEEPPAHVYFILMTPNLSYVLPTLLSRCQKYTVQYFSELNSESFTYVNLSARYVDDSMRHEMMQKYQTLREQMILLIQDKATVCHVAEQWKAVELSDFLWLLFLINAELIKLKSDDAHQVRIDDPQWAVLANATHLPQLFGILDKMNVLQRKLNHNVSMNSILAIEDLLLDYVGNVPNVIAESAKVIDWSK